MRLFSLKAAAIYLAISTALYSYEFVSLYGNYFETASQKPVYPTFYFLNQTLLTSINAFFERNLLLGLMSMIFIPILNIIALIISIKFYKKVKNKNEKQFSLALIIIGLIPWLSYLYMLFFR